MRALRGTVLLAAASVAAAAASAPAGAAKLPDWAAAVAASAPEIPAGVLEHDSRVLLEETHLEVQPDGRFRTRVRRAVQALTAAAGDVGIGYFPFDDDTEIESSSVWHLSPDGKAKKRTDAGVDFALDDMYFLTDDRVRFIKMEGVVKGSLVFFEFETVEMPYQLAYDVLFYDYVPTGVARFEVRVPAGWTVRHDWRRGETHEPRVAGDVTVWELRDLQPIEEETLGESPVDVTPRLVVSFEPPADVELRPARVTDWRAVAAWFERLAQDREKATPEVSSRADAVFTGIEPDFFSRVGAASTYVRDRVRYVAKEVGVGGYLPRPAAEVLRDLYGDCKDKGTLLRALLATAGLASYPVFVNLTLEQTVSESVPSLSAFDHFVVAVPIPGDVEIPEEFVAATTSAQGLGRLLIVDTTDEYTSIGSISAGLSGKTGLVVAGERSALITLPGRDPGAHRIVRRCDSEILDDGSVAMKMETVRRGGPASLARYFYRQSSQDFVAAIEQGLRDRWPGLEVEGCSVVEETEDGAFVESASLILPAPDDASRAGHLSVFPGAIDELPRVSLTRRTTPVKYEYPVTLEYRSTVRNYPADTIVPEDLEAAGDGWSVAARFERDDDGIRGTWEAVLERTRFAPEDFDTLKEFWSTARRASSVAVVTKR